MGELEDYKKIIDEWGYCYCLNCNEVIDKYNLEATIHGIRCSKCKKYNLDPPGWVRCPQEGKGTMVKCPRGGKGIKKTKNGYECQDKCFFRNATKRFITPKI